jgi:hypothetical protein
MVREQGAAATQQQHHQHPVTAPHADQHTPAAEAAAESPADDASASKDPIVAADTQHPSTSIAQSSSSSSTRPQKGSSSSLASDSTASLQSLAVKFVLPAFVAAAAIAWLLRRGSGSSKSGSRGSTPTRKHSQKHRSTKSSKQQQQAQQQQDDEASEADEGPEPESRLALFASDFQLHTQDVQLVARPAALEGLTCVVAEHLPIQVSPPSRFCFSCVSQQAAQLTCGAVDMERDQEGRHVFCRVLVTQAAAHSCISRVYTGVLQQVSSLTKAAHTGNVVYALLSP